MCGIVGYAGPKSAVDVVVDGLRRLEYRGYDSAGVCVVADGHLSVAKRAGKLANLEKELAEHPLPVSGLAIGHTRWATHGGPTDTNAHPHLSANGRVAVVHNGIIENFAQLRSELAEVGITPVSQTDTEIAAQLLGLEVEKGAGLSEALRAVCNRLEGAFTLVAVDAEQPDTVAAARRNSPLVVGVGDPAFAGPDAINPRRDQSLCSGRAFSWSLVQDVIPWMSPFWSRIMFSSPRLTRTGFDPIPRKPPTSTTA